MRHSKAVKIIAEAGVNHNGDITIAKSLIDVAADSGADYVKFQTFKAESIVSKYAKKAKYQSKNLGDRDNTQFQMLKDLELDHEAHLTLLKYANQKGIQFFSTAFDVEGVEYLNKLGLPMFKIPSGEITNFPYLKAIAGMKKPLILSTGMSNIGEIEAALSILIKYGAKRTDITILHCNTEYPTPMEDVNLKAMQTIGNAFGVQFGYSDHTLGIEVPIAAVALGATIIEKHFTLDRNMHGPDHKASLEPIELKKMIYCIRNIEKAISGTGRKEVTNSELKNKIISRKSIHLKQDKYKGDLLREEDLIPLRPGDGISAIYWNNVIGKRLQLDKNAFDKLTWSDIL